MEDVSEESKVVRNQSLPLLVDFLKLAVISDKIILFDFKELPDSHPHASNLVNATLKAINEVGMLHEKVRLCMAETCMVHAFMYIYTLLEFIWFTHSFSFARAHV